MKASAERLASVREAIASYERMRAESEGSGRHACSLQEWVTLKMSCTRAQAGKWLREALDATPEAPARPSR